MNNLALKAIIALIQLIIGLAVMLFVPAWTLDYWQAWVYLFVFAISVLIIFVYLYKNDLKLLERRLERTEKEKSQKGIQFYIFMAYISLFMISSLDHRWGWSNVCVIVVVLGDFLVGLGYFIIYLVLKENSFAATTITTHPGQKVITTGPYAIIRHPMYAGALILILGTPLALGSWVGEVLFVAIASLLVWRQLEEEKFLFESLPGYKEYSHQVKYRLIPLIW